jgi:hypothetical protein
MGSEVGLGIPVQAVESLRVVRSWGSHIFKHSAHRGRQVCRKLCTACRCSACYFAFTPPLTLAVLGLWPWLLIYDKRKWRGGFFLLLWCLHAFLDGIGISREHTESECVQWVTTIGSRERHGFGYKMTTVSSTAGEWDTLISVKTHGSF